MTPGGSGDVRLGTAQVIARLGITTRHLRRLVKAGRFPPGHYLGERRRWWLSEVQTWEAANTSAEPPRALYRSIANLQHQGAA